MVYTTSFNKIQIFEFHQHQITQKHILIKLSATRWMIFPLPQAFFFKVQVLQTYSFHVRTQHTIINI